VLYGASYFTEEEFIRIDGIINKGQYVFTNGPKNLLEEELLSFEDSDDQTLKIPVNTSFSTVKGETAVVSEAAISSPTSSEHPTDYLEETPNGTSAEVSSDEESAPPLTADASPMFDFTETIQETSGDPIEIPKREPVAIPATGGLALGYTQAQLDEVKAFNASFEKKAGEKTHPKHGKVVKRAYPSSARSGEGPVKNPHNQSPTPTEHDTHIKSWVSGVKSQEAELLSPTPRKGPVKSDILPPAAKVLVEEFTKTHGKKPKDINDLIQPNNPQFRTLDKRPGSRASNTTSKTVKSAEKLVAPEPALDRQHGNPQLNVPSGTILVAHKSAPKLSKIDLEVSAGDKIRVLKHVSGLQHHGENLRTLRTGQFSEKIFYKAVEEQRAIATQKAHIGAPSSVVSNGLDRIEGMNAAEWDEVKVISRPRTTAPAAKKPAPTPLGGLSASRYAVLADEAETVVSSSSDQQEVMTREEMGKIIDEKVCFISSFHNSYYTNS
jgi:hypothetical protein